MARKKYEFKPDSEESGILGKLYLTKKQRLAVLKWSLFGLVCLVLLIVQDVIFSPVSLWGATTDLVSCGILLICVCQGAEIGGVFALISSMIFLFSGSAPGPYSMVFLTVYGILAAIFRQAYLRKGFTSMTVCAAGALLLYELSVFVICLFLQPAGNIRLSTFLLSWLLSLIAVPILYPIVLSIGKIGGETWKE